MKLYPRQDEIEIIELDKNMIQLYNYNKNDSSKVIPIMYVDDWYCYYRAMGRIDKLKQIEKYYYKV